MLTTARGKVQSSGVRVVAVVIAATIFADPTIVAAKTQTITIRTMPYVPGTTCTVSSSSIGKKSVEPPATLTVEQAWSAIEVRCSNQCLIGVETLRPALFGGYPPVTSVSLKWIKNCAQQK
jgi:hypothetical protein